MFCETSFVEFAIRQLNLSSLQAGFTHDAAEFIPATSSFQADFIQPSFNCTLDDAILFLTSISIVLLSLQYDLHLDVLRLHLPFTSKLKKEE